VQTNVSKYSHSVTSDCRATCLVTWDLQILRSRRNCRLMMLAVFGSLKEIYLRLAHSIIHRMPDCKVYTHNAATKTDT